MPAFFRCEHCGEPHLIPYPFEDEAAFRDTAFTRHVFACERTDDSAVYGSEDFFWWDGEGEPPSEPPGAPESVGS